MDWGSKDTLSPRPGSGGGPGGNAPESLRVCHIFLSLKMAKGRTIFIPYCIKTQEMQQFVSQSLKVLSK